MSCGVETEANALMNALLNGVETELPEIDFSGPEYNIPEGTMSATVTRISNNDLTTKVIDGTGTFDILMSAFRVHLKEEYEKNRITGAEYTKAYIELTTAAMAQGVAFLLQREQTYWANQLAQAQAITAKVELATAKLNYAVKRMDALTISANYALAKIRVATGSNEFCLTKNELEVLRPLQASTLEKDIEMRDYQIQYQLPGQLQLILEQVEAARAQTMDTRTDGVTTITGSVGKQKALYTQQITSYQRDAELKAGKIFSDAWIAMKTIDEGVLPPSNFSNANLDVVLGHLRLNNNLD